MYNPFDISGKTFLITGASSGIGKAISIEISKMNGTVIITGRNQERLNAVFDALEGNNHIQLIADLTDSHQIEKIVNDCPQINGIVHCAGINNLIPFQFINREKLWNIMETNFNAPVILTQQMLKAKKIRNNSSIVFISSISGVYCSSIGGSLYSASKGAINGLIKGMALDLATKGIRINSVNPGVVETNIFETSGISKENLENEKKHYPLKRFGKPEEIAYAVIYLLSAASEWVTGTNIIIDGGFTLT